MRYGLSLYEVHSKDPYRIGIRKNPALRPGDDDLCKSSLAGLVICFIEKRGQHPALELLSLLKWHAMIELQETPKLLGDIDDQALSLW